MKVEFLDERDIKTIIKRCECPICGGPMHLGRSVNEVLVYCDNYAYCGYCRRPTPQEELNDGS